MVGLAQECDVKHNMRLFHGSHTRFDVLKPLSVLHARKVLYASTHLPFACLFCANWSDAQIQVSEDGSGGIVVTELEADAFSLLAVSGVLHVVDGGMFERNLSIMDCERVTESEVAVLSHVDVADVLTLLQDHGGVTLRGHKGLHALV